MKTKLLACIALLALPDLVAGAAASAEADYVAHEWGTFTSVQGADGVQMHWNPLTILELPKFVYDLARPGGLLRSGSVLTAKTAFSCRQRMETPVIYFYADRPHTIEVAVDFPEGTVTEWYPRAQFADLKTGAINPKRLPPNTNALRWPKVQILPQKDAAEVTAALRQDATGSHYFAARETEANLVSVGDKDLQETEKFLFYRGVGNFQAPLTVRLPSSDESEMVLENTGPEELRHLFVYGIRGAKGVWVSVDRLAAGETRAVRVDLEKMALPFADLRPSLTARMEAALVAEGLYPLEAASMVKTWDTSWFSESGLRVLYTLPRQWTDRILPLRITPAPREAVRVMVGRAEIITPRTEKAFEEQLTHFIDGNEAARAAAVGRASEIGLGRFAEPALRRILARGERSREFVSKSWEFLQATKQPGVGKTPTTSVTTTLTTASR